MTDPPSNPRKPDAAMPNATFGGIPKNHQNPCLAHLFHTLFGMSQRIRANAPERSKRNGRTQTEARATASDLAPYLICIDAVPGGSRKAATHCKAGQAPFEGSLDAVPCRELKRRGRPASTPTRNGETYTNGPFAKTGYPCTICILSRRVRRSVQKNAKFVRLETDAQRWKCSTTLVPPDV